MFPTNRGWIGAKPPTGSFRLNKHSEQADGLVGWWPTANFGGNVLRDYSRNKTNGTLALGAAGVTSRMGRAINFDGVNDYVELGTIPVGHPLQLAGDGQVSISAWIYCRDGSEDWYRIIDKSNGGNGTNGWCVFIQPSPAELGDEDRVWFKADGNVALTTNNNTLLIDQWMHLFITGTGVAGEGAIYQNGESVALTDNDAYTIPDVQTNAKIGWWNHAALRHFDGMIYDLRVYNKYHTPNEAYQFYDPKTRWELFEPISPKIYPGAFVEQEQIANAITLIPSMDKHQTSKPPTGSFKLNKASPQAEELLLWSPFIAGRGGSVIPDLLGRGLLGDVSGAVWTANGKHGYGLEFDSANNGVGILSGTDKIDPSFTSLTLSAWVRWNGDDGNYQMILGKREGWPNVRWQFMYDEPAGSIALQSGTNSVVFTGFAPTVGKLQHILVTQNGTSSYLYLDGIQADTGNSVVPQGSASSVVCIGNYYDDGYSDIAWNGAIYEARVQNKFLSASEAWEQYSNPWELYEPIRPRVWPAAKLEETPVEAPMFSLPKLKTSKPPVGDFRLNEDSEQAKGLVGWWPTVLGGGKNVLRDLGGRKYNGAFPGGTADPSWVTSERGRALSFDGDDDYIELGTIPVGHPLQLADNQLTIACWLYVNDGGDDYQRIIDKSDGGASANGWGLNIHPKSTADVYQFFFTADNGATAKFGSIDNTLLVDQWMHLAITGTGVAGEARCYVNGLSVGMVRNASYNIPEVETNARIGTWNHATAREFGGLLGDLRVYNQALSAGGVRQQYSKPWELYKPIRPIFFGYSTEEEEPAYIWPFSDNFTGSDDDPWDVDKWTTSEG